MSKTAFFNAKVYIEKGVYAEAVLQEDGWIKMVGTTGEILSMAGYDAEKIDCGGKTIIPGFNDSDENMEATARFVADVLPGAEVHLLPYHNYGAGKYEALDRPYPMGDLERPPAEQMEHSKEFFDRFNLDCRIKI